MNFSSDDLFSLYGNGELPAFYCDNDWNISSINDSFAEKFPDVKVLQNVRDFSKNNTSFFLEAQKRLSKGLPFFSTNFELLFQNATLYALPQFSQQAIDNLQPVCSSYFCIVEVQKIPPQQPLFNITNSLRSPISDILNSATFLATRAEYIEDYKAIDYLQHIAKCCYSMLRTTSSTKTYYNLVNHIQPVTKKKILLNSFFKELAQTLQILFFKSKYHFIYSICDEKIISKIDPELISLMIFHLVSNACAASPEQSDISILLSSVENENYYTITVSDEGNGIKSNILDDIFKPFFTFSGSTVAEENIHLGLGLPIVEEIIKLHDGVIFFNSRNLKGTNVTVKFPISSPTNEPLTLQTSTTKYATNKFSDSYIIFSDICDINLL